MGVIHHIVKEIIFNTRNCKIDVIHEAGGFLTKQIIYYITNNYYGKHNQAVSVNTKWHGGNQEGVQSHLSLDDWSDKFNK